MNLHQAIEKHEYLLLEDEACPLSKTDMQEIELLAEHIDYETVDDGDAGDRHKVKVGRFRKDVELPTDLTNQSPRLMEIINSPKMQSFYRELTQFDNVCIRRSQVNILDQGDYVGLHIDGVGDPKYKGSHIDYQYALVLHFDVTYEGGDVVVYPENKKKKVRLTLPPYCMYAIIGRLPHEVEVVTKGHRKSLVYFLSDNFGQSKYD